MTPRKAIALTALLLASAPLGAQSTERYIIDFGAAKGRRLDASISPIALKGTGGLLGIGYERRSGPWTATARIQAGGHFMEPELEAVRSEEFMGAYTGRFGMLREIARSPLRGMFSVGLMADVSITATSHHYADAGNNSSNFSMSLASLSPTAAWRGTVGGGMMQFAMTAPLLTVAHHSWSELKEQRDAPGFRTFGPGTLRAASLEGTFERGVSRTLSMRVSYRGDALQFDDTQPVRAFQQSATFGIVLHRTPRPQ
jgi:hypothetical protein